MTKVISWNALAINDGTNYRAAILYSHSLPSVSPVFIERTNADALVGNASQSARQLPELGIVVEAGSVATIQAQFNPRDKQAKALVISDDDGSNQRYVMAYCVSLDQVPGSGGVSFVATLFAHGDVYWRAGDATTSSGSLTASGQTVAVTNDGEMEAFPIITITPTSAKSSGNGNVYRQFWAVPWVYTRGATREPVDIVGAALDTQIATTNFASATGDDIRVYVDGVPVDFWLSAPNTAATKLWVNLDFAAGVSLTLDGAVNDSATSLVFNEAIDALPSSGILHFTANDEVVVYTAKNNATKTVSGVTRGAKGTSAASQSDAAAVAWLQHDVWVTYGDSSLAAYVPDDTYKPVFSLSSSTNTSWVYSGEFGSDARVRSGSWVPGAGIGGNTASAGYCFSRDHSSGSGSETVTPWDAVGVAQTGEGATRFSLYSARGISAANVTAGKSKTANAAAAASFAAVQSATDGNDWTAEYSIPATSGTTWESWSASLSSLYTASSKETRYICLYIAEAADDTESYKAQLTAVTVTLQSGVASVGIGEIDAYSADYTLSISETGDALRWQAAAPLNGAVVIDTAARTVTLPDGSSGLDGLTLTGGVRADWLPIPAGGGTLVVTETGLIGVDVDVDVVERFYD